MTLVRSATQRAAVRAEAVVALTITQAAGEKWFVLAHFRDVPAVVLSDHLTEEGAERELEVWIRRLNEAAPPPLIHVPIAGGVV